MASPLTVHGSPGKKSQTADASASSSPKRPPISEKKVSNNRMKNILLSHIARYPLGTPQDWIKLLYQSEFGAGHLIHDRQAALVRILEECRTMTDVLCPPAEPIGGGFARMHLQSLRRLGIAETTLHGLFLLAAQDKCGTPEGMNRKLDLLISLADENLLPASKETVRSAVSAYRAEGCPMVSHSEVFRAHYHPAYRLVPETVLRFLPLFAKIDSLLSQKEFINIAIDGNCGAGKTTLGEMLRAVYDANLFHMDDYFLPFPRKTSERLALPGGNVDHERFDSEIAPSLRTHSPVTFRAYDCSTGSLGEAVTVPATRVSVTEGSYSLYPTLRNAYDLTVFLSLDPETQSRRILQRNGEAMHRRFINEWIPMENHYFDALNIRALCDLAFDC